MRIIHAVFARVCWATWLAARWVAIVWACGATMAVAGDGHPFEHVVHDPSLAWVAWDRALSEGADR